MIRRGGLPALGALALFLAFGCSSDTDKPLLDNPFDPRNSEDLPVPDSVLVTVGNNLVRLDWSVENPDTVQEYAVFRRRVDETSAEELMAQVKDRCYEDRRARNGRTYEYRIASGVAGRFGKRSDAVEASPGQFSLVVDDDAPKTRNRTTEVSITSTLAVSTIRLSESPDISEVPWRTVTQPTSWVLSAGDGEKSVYGQFGLADGSQSIRVMDTIELDTQAVIRSVEFTGSEITSPGAAIHFRLDGGETGGFASIDVSGVFSGLTLFDDGSLGDMVPGDGIYERDARIPVGSGATRATVTGTFRDDVGNQAGSMSAPRTLTVEEAPDPVSLVSSFTAEPPSPPSITLRWTQSQDGDFESYRIYRDQAHVVDATDRLVGSVFSRGTLEFSDSDVVEGDLYSYRVYVRTGLGLESGSNTLQVAVPNLRTPATVTVEDPDAMSASRLALRWSRNSDRDFLEYRVFRNETGAVTEADSMIAGIVDPGFTFLDDTGLRENTEYHYRVYVFDSGGLWSRSNEVSGRTVNESPEPVQLDPPSPVGSTDITLTWTRSDAHDFAFYRLYQDTIPTVSTASESVVELDERETTTFQVTGLDPSTRYYFRLFVFDDGVNPGPKSSGSNTVTAETTSSVVQGEP